MQQSSIDSPRYNIVDGSHSDFAPRAKWGGVLRTCSLRGPRAGHAVFAIRREPLQPIHS